MASRLKALAFAARAAILEVRAWERAIKAGDGLGPVSWFETVSIDSGR